MPVTKKTILIVEDDEDLSLQYRLFCQVAANSLYGTNPEHIRIRSATSIDQAKMIVDQEPVDFVSVDLALRSNEKDLKDVHRKMGLEPGGMIFIRHLQIKPKRPISIIVSGETLLSYVTDSLQKYGVFAYFQKSDPDLFEKYQHAIKAALLYLDADQILSDIETLNASINSLDVAGLYWKQAVQEAVSADAGEKSFPVNLSTRIKSIGGEVDSDAKIPNAKWTERVLKALLAEEDWTLIQVRINNFEQFVELQQSQIGPLFFFISNLLTESIKKLGFPINYVGLWRGELGGTCLLVVIKSPQIIGLDSVLRTSDAKFRVSADKFTHNQDLMVADSTAQKVVPELSFRSWHKQDFSDWHELIDKLGNPSL